MSMKTEYSGWLMEFVSGGKNVKIPAITISPIVYNMLSAKIETSFTKSILNYFCDV